MASDGGGETSHKKTFVAFLASPIFRFKKIGHMSNHVLFTHVLAVSSQLLTTKSRGNKFVERELLVNLNPICIEPQCGSHMHLSCFTGRMSDVTRMPHCNQQYHSTAHDSTGHN